MKRALSFIIAAVLILTSFQLISFASYEEAEVKVEGKITDYPIIMLPGYSGCRLYYGDDPETGVCAWGGVSLDELGPNLLNRIAEIALGLGIMKFDNADYVASILAQELKDTWPMMGCNPDGTSTYELHPYYTTPETTNSQWLSDTDNDFCRHDREIASCFDDYVGKENLFNFNIDWRMGVETLASQLNDYVKAVKKYTGKDKVNIYGISHGGQIGAAYLALYGSENDVDNVVLSSPAIGGSNLASDILLQKVDADEQTIIEMIEQVTYTEENYEWLVKANELGFIDDVINAMVPYVADSMGYWPSIWDLTPVDEYEECKAKFLNKPENEPLVKQSDKFHYDILPLIKERLPELKNKGVDISIITGSGYRVASGAKLNSDAIIPVASATGATAASFGERFADDYTQINSCNGNYKLSPDMTIDASTCYLPENTWFSFGNFHAWTYFSDVTKQLNVELLLTDNFKNVNDNPLYPQFLQSDNESKSFVYNFNNATSGFITADSDTLEIKNVMSDSDVRILGVYIPSSKIRFDTGVIGTKIKPGETAQIKFSGDFSSLDKKCVDVVVIYSMNNITPIDYKTSGFTVL